MSAQHTNLPEVDGASAFAGHPAAPRLSDAATQPWRHGFLALLRHLSAIDLGLPAIGDARRPLQENFRLGQKASLGFAPREIAEVTRRRLVGSGTGEEAELPLIRLFSLGMMGPNGPLPLHFTEIVRERSDAKRDDTLAHFIDLFHHRHLVHLYRAWAQAQAAAGLDRADAETFTPYVARLAGDEVREVSSHPLPSHARWASAAHRIRSARNPDGLVATLAHFFGVSVRLEEWVAQWIEVEPEDLFYLGKLRRSTALGRALAGSVVRDRQHKFRLVIGPLNLEQYLRFTPQGSSTGNDLRALIEWVRAFIGYEYAWEVQLLVRQSEAPPAQLGGNPKQAHLLGWSSWMGQAPPDTPVGGMIFEPEGYDLSLHGQATPT